MAAKDLTPEELQEEPRMAFPMTHVVEGFPCIANYPIDEWEEAGTQMMTTKGWANLCLKVAEKDL
eukprot:2954927-Lingulodinium_polyedra.AAC.1